MLKLVPIFFVVLLFSSNASAEIMTFEKEVEEVVANDQSREQVEAFALQKAKRLAVEEAGTYITSLTVVSNAQLQKEEITALASGVVQAKIVGMPTVRMENGVIHVKVTGRIQVDTAILDKQVAELLKEKGNLKKLEAEQRKVRELEEKLSSLKSTELKRLEELNIQAIILEQERERRRMANAELALKAQGELKKAEIKRLEKERELQKRTARMLAEQQKQRKAEVTALAAEQDRIRRAQLENEQRWNDLARKSLLAQQQWIAIDDSLSLMQALEEASTIKKEIATIRQRSEFQYQESIATLKMAYKQQLVATTAKLPPQLAEKDPFEPSTEYDARVAAHDAQVEAAIKENEAKIEKLNDEETLKLVQAKVEYLKQQIRVLEPFVKRLQALQARMFVLPGEAVTIELGAPDADRSCFPATITHENERWTVDWKYTNRNMARDIFSTRNFLKAEAMVQLDKTSPAGYIMTEARITHPGTGLRQNLVVAHPKELSEIDDFDKSKTGELAEAEKEVAEAIMTLRYGHNLREPITGMEFVPVEQGATIYFMGKYEVTQGQWRKIMGNNPSGFSSCGDDCPVEQVSWNEANQFIERLNSQSKKIKYRLPTEAEWQFACTSGGRNEEYCGGRDVDAVAWHRDNSGNRTHVVGSKQPNGLGIYDMSGNVSEWVSDMYGNLNKIRGGSWQDFQHQAGAVYTTTIADWAHETYIGFRICFSVGKP